jgi:hypothetical protein
LPKEKETWMRLHGFKKTEVFGFLTKRDALGFIKDISKDDVEWAIADARGNV